MENEKILEILYGERKDYKGTGIMRDLLADNEEFKNIILEGIKLGKILGFDDELWDKIDSQNIRGINTFLDVFKEGANLGYCTVAAKQLSYSFPNDCRIAGGVVDYLQGTKNSEDGSHTWIVWNGKIYDTTFMLSIDLEFANKLKYIQENIYNPLDDDNYCATKEFTNDPTINPGRKSK